MPIHFRCQACGKTLRVRDDQAGRRGKCPGCGSVITVPPKDTPEPGRVAGVGADRQAENGSPQKEQPTVSEWLPATGLIAVIVGLAILSSGLKHGSLTAFVLGLLTLLVGVSFLGLAARRRSQQLRAQPLRAELIAQPPAPVRPALTPELEGELQAHLSSFQEAPLYQVGRAKLIMQIDVGLLPIGVGAGLLLGVVDFPFSHLMGLGAVVGGLFLVLRRVVLAIKGVPSKTAEGTARLFVAFSSETWDTDWRIALACLTPRAQQQVGGGPDRLKTSLQQEWQTIGFSPSDGISGLTVTPLGGQACQASFKWSGTSQSQKDSVSPSWILLSWGGRWYLTGVPMPGLPNGGPNNTPGAP
jgi:DNA-directed RNA polymerase subunit RPC12/RpoP